jgi:dephospho-CoA kinase
MIIGITGKAGSGKSYIAKYLCERFKYKYINADEVAHVMYADPYSLATMLIKEEFGDKVMRFDEGWYEDVVDRTKLGQLVFKSKVQMNKLNKLMLPLIEWRIGHTIMEYTKQPVNMVIDGALLTQTNIVQYCDIVVVVDAIRNVRLRRLTNKRDVDEKIANKMVDAVKIVLKTKDLKKIIYIQNNDDGFIPQRINDWEEYSKI